MIGVVPKVICFVRFPTLRLSLMVLVISISSQTSLVSDSHKFRMPSPCPETEMDTQSEDFAKWDVGLKGHARIQLFLQVIKCTMLAIGK